MAWNPEINVLTPRVIPNNLVAYCMDPTRQAEALVWAGGALKPIKTAHNSLAEPDKPIYPSVHRGDDDDAQDTEDLITGAYAALLELRIQNSNADTAVSNAITYTKAWLSMIANCPAATYLAGSGATSAAIQLIETKFEAIKVHSERKNDFRQDVSIKITYSLNAAAKV